MPKLHLKRTPEEEAARQWRKKQKRDKSKRRHHSSYTHDHSNSDISSHKHSRRNTTDSNNRKWGAGDDNDDDMEYILHPNMADSSSVPFNPAFDPNEDQYKPDYEAIRAELEEQRFREKMCGAFEDDERLDSLEAQLNDFAHVPERWRTGRTSKAKLGKVYEDDEEAGGILNMDPRYMDDEEYAEWIRAGMYRWATSFHSSLLASG
jgi:hypothetical protein